VHDSDQGAPLSGVAPARDEAITPEIFAHLVDLAALELEPEEAEYLRGQLNGQLKAVRELAAIQAGEDVPITSHGVPYTSATSPALRADAAVVCPDAQAILDQAPEVEERYIVVPDIPGTELE
jgi:aspartyl-tRNA(Asn)/glutamyl-tRNA(Gln) amidotransferase subunit C